MNRKANVQKELQLILNCSFDIICSIDRQGRITRINEAVENILGFRPAEVIGKRFTRSLLKSDLARTTRARNCAIREGRVIRFANRYYTKDHSIAYLSWSLIYDDDSDLLHCVGHDYTELHGTQAALEKSNERLFYFTQAVHDAMWDWDVVKNKVFWGYGYREFFGYDIDDSDLDRSAWRTRIHPDDRSQVIQSIQDAWDDGSVSWEKEYRYEKADGSYAFVMDRAIILRNSQGNPVRMIGAMHDDTERKKAEEERLFRKQLFKSLIQNGSDLLGIIDANGCCSFVSSNVEHILGYSPESIVGRRMFSIVHVEDRPQLADALLKAERETEVRLQPIRVLHGKKGWRWFDVILTNLAHNPAVKGIVANARDITGEIATREQLENLSLIAKETTNPVVITDAGGRIIWINNAFFILYEYSVEEVIGRQPVELLSGLETPAGASSTLRAAIDKLLPAEAEMIYYSKSGKKYYVEVQVQPVLDESGKVIRYFGLHHDITARKMLEQQLWREQQETQRRISEEVITAQERERSDIGRELHDNVNQILATIKLYLGMLVEGKSYNEALLDKCFKYANTAIEEIRRLSRRLSASSIDEFNLGDAIAELVYSLNAGGKTVFRTNIGALQTIAVRQPLAVSMYRIIQEQTTNILKYAEASEAYIAIDITPGRELMLTVTDNGIGFDMSRKRNGIGLNNIITRAAVHFGKVSIEASPGQGCRITAVFDLLRHNIVPTGISASFDD